MTLPIRRILGFLRRETVLCVAVVLAIASAFVVPPSADYLGYIDWDTLALLFSLMAVMKGYQQIGIFARLSDALLQRVATTRGMVMVLVFLPFFLSMVVTNDVSLITFVPFALVVLRMAGWERLIVPTVILQTIAANLGSMLTPMGNPQNLYLYARSGMGFGELVTLTLPYVAVSGIVLAAVIGVGLRRPKPVQGVSVDVHVCPVDVHVCRRRSLVGCTGGFVLCLLAIFGLVPPWAIAALAAVTLLVVNRRVLASVDYSLLATFVAFFIFIGNMGNIGPFRDLLAVMLEGRVQIVSVLASQIVSNVPAALLLSGFTDDWSGLIVGCNLGGLGTLIASMASLISYKMVAREYPQRRGRYLLWFTIANVALLALLLMISAVL